MRTIAAVCALALLALGGCVVTGQDFPSASVGKIVKGSTTQAEILATFGPPYMKLDKGGKLTWTYYRELLGLPNRHQAKELKVIFNERKIVEDYSFTVNYPEEPQKP